MQRTLFEQIKAVVQDQTQRVGVIVSNLHGPATVAGASSSSPAAQAWFVATMPASSLPTFSAFYHAFTLEAPSVTTQAASEGQLVVPRAGAIPPKSVVFLSASVELDAARSVPLDVLCPGYEVALYRGAALLASGRDRLHAAPRLPGGRTPLTLLLFGGGGSIQVTVPTDVALLADARTPQAPVLSDLTFFDLDPARGRFLNRLTWGNAPEAAAWGVYRAETTALGAIYNTSLSGNEAILRLPGSPSVTVDEVAYAAFGLAGQITAVATGTETSGDPYTELTLTVSDEAPTEAAGWNGQTYFQPSAFHPLATLGNAGASTVQFDDTALQVDAVYLYALTAFGLLGARAESDYSAVCWIYTNDTEAPAGITSPLARTSGDVVTLDFISPTDPDYAGLRVYGPYPVDGTETIQRPASLDVALRIQTTTSEGPGLADQISFRAPAGAANVAFLFATFDRMGNEQAATDAWAWTYGGALPVFQMEYAQDDAGTGAHATFDPAVDLYARQSGDAGQTWTDWFRIVGESGDPGGAGPYTDYIFTSAPIGTTPATPTGDPPSAPAGSPAVTWGDAPPVYDVTTDVLWMSEGDRRGSDDALLSAWSTPVPLTGAQGPAGTDFSPPGITITQVALSAAEARTLTRVQVDATVSGAGRSIQTLTYRIGAGTETAVANGGTIDVPRGTSQLQDRWLYLTATSNDGISRTVSFLVDFDRLPGFSSVSAPVPIYSGSAVVGWRIDGVVDDDARSLRVTVPAGVSVRSDSVPPVSSGVLSLGSTKSFSLCLDQTAGSQGRLFLTPCSTTDGTGTQSDGTAGEPWGEELRLAPRTAVTLKEETSTRRRLTLQTDPPTGRIYVQAIRASSGTAVPTYLRTAGGTLDPASATTAERSAAGPALTLYVDLLDATGEDVLVQYYAVASSVTESLHQLRLDTDDAPEVTLSATGDANVLTVTATPDDDLVYWKLWARRASWPTTDGTETGMPLDSYLYLNGSQQDRTVSWWAKEGTWYLLARAYDRAGAYTQASWSGDVSATASTAAALSAITTTREDNATGADYHLLSWSHNAAITSTSGHQVEILEGRTVKTTVDASLDAAEIETPEQKTSTEANAVFRQYDYTLRLLDSLGTVITSYPTSVSGYYDNGTVTVTPPSEVPDTPTLSVQTNGGYSVSATWGNTSEQWQIDFDWGQNGTYGYATGTLAPSMNTLTQYYAADAIEADLRVRYTNAAGAGNWSSPGRVIFS